MSRFAENTSVPADRSRSEIERTLARYGATSFMYGWQGGDAVLAFSAKGRSIRFLLPLPDRNNREFTHTPARRTPRTASAAEEAYDQAVRQRWRALALVIKAKLEAVESGITTFEDEFLAHTMLPGGQTVSESVAESVAAAYETGQVGAILPDYSKPAIPIGPG